MCKEKRVKRKSEKEEYKRKTDGKTDTIKEGNRERDQANENTQRK